MVKQSFINLIKKARSKIIGEELKNIKRLVIFEKKGHKFIIIKNRFLLRLLYNIYILISKQMADQLNEEQIAEFK